MTHTGHDMPHRAGNAAGSVLATGQGHHAVCIAMHDQSGHSHTGQQLGTASVGHDSHGLAQNAGGSVRTANGGFDLPAQNSLIEGMCRAGNQLNQTHIVRYGTIDPRFGG